jgi:hypothetical protein
VKFYSHSDRSQRRTIRVNGDRLQLELFDEGETYDSNVVKEAEEELGIAAVKPVVVRKDRVSTPTRNYFRVMYSVVIDRKIEDFKIQKAEVLAIQWISKDALVRWWKEKPNDFIASMPTLIELFCS